MRRAAALLAAVAMVVGALAYRSARDDEGGSGSGGRARAEVAQGMVCAADLADVCAAAGIPVAATEAAGITADALIGADDVDVLAGEAWLVTRAWASLVDDERTRIGADPLFAVDGGALASSPVVLAVWSDRAEQVAARCGLPPDAVTWRCLAEQTGSTLEEGDRVRVAIPDVDTGVGLEVAASQAAGLLGRTDFASNDFDAGDFRARADLLAAGQAPDPVRAMRAQGPGRVTAAGGVAAGATNLSSTFGSIRPSVPEPAVRADVVLVVPAGSDTPDETRRALVEALLAAGWDPPADGPDGLPAGGVLAAVRTLWSQSR